MNHRTHRPDYDGQGIAPFGAQLVYQATGKQHGNGIGKLEYGGYIGVIAVRPSEDLFQLGFQ